MIELSDDIKQIFEVFEKSENAVLEGVAHQISLFKPDKKYTHINKMTFVCHDAWEMDRLSWQKCKKTIILEETDDAKILKTYYEFPKKDAVNDMVIVLGKGEKENLPVQLSVKSGEKFRKYVFSISKKGIVEKFKEIKTSQNKNKTQKKELQRI